MTRPSACGRPVAVADLSCPPSWRPRRRRGAETVNQAQRARRAGRPRRPSSGRTHAFGLDLHARLRPGARQHVPLPLQPLDGAGHDGRRRTGRDGPADGRRPPFPVRPGPGRRRPSKSLIRSLRPGGDEPRGYQLHTANALWGQRGYHFLPEFLATLRGPFEATFEEVDFRSARRGRPADHQRLGRGGDRRARSGT